MYPRSGVVKPAMQSSRVVFPAPDAPKMMVMPCAIVNVTSSSKPSLCFLWTRTSTTVLAGTCGLGHSRTLFEKVFRASPQGLKPII